MLLERERLAGIDLAVGSVGGELRVMASGIGDSDSPPVSTLRIQARALRPPSPVHLRAKREPSGDLAICWVRRSRNGWVWLSGSDTPLGEEIEAYRLVLSRAGSERTLSLSSPHYTYTAAQQAQDGLPSTLSIAVSQLGTHGASEPARISIG